jgi:hypothetical protein
MRWWESVFDRAGRALIAAAMPPPTKVEVGTSTDPEPEKVEAGNSTDPEPASDYHVGLAVAQLLCYGQDWVSRRTETFTFTSATTVQRKMGVDFALPRDDDSAGTLDPRALRIVVRYPGPTYVPLTTLRKGPLTAFDLVDEDQRSLSLLTTEANGRITGEALVALAFGVRIKHQLEPFPRSVIEALKGVAQLPERDAGLLLRCLTEGTEAAWGEITSMPADEIEDLRTRADALRRLEQNRPAVAENVRALMCEEPLRALARKLARDFAVLVPLEGDPYRRRVIKLAYQEPIEHRTGYKKARSRRSRALAERLCWRPKTLAFSRIAAGDGEGHHVELVAPEGMEIARASFSAYVPAGAAVAGSPAAASAGPPEREVVDALGSEPAQVHPADRHVLEKPDNPARAHMHLRKLPPQAIATARLQLRASPSGMLNAATIVATLIVGVVWWGSYRTAHISQADAAAAILLAAPTLLAAYIARPGEHELVTMVLSGVRILIAVAGLVMFVAAASLAFGYDECQLEVLWKILRWVAIVPALALLWSSFRVRRPGAPSNPPGKRAIDG